MDDTTSNKEQMESQNVSEEQLLEEHFHDLLLELNRDTQDEYFDCQDECNTLKEEHIVYN